MEEASLFRDPVTLSLIQALEDVVAVGEVAEAKESPFREPDAMVGWWSLSAKWLENLFVPLFSIDLNADSRFVVGAVIGSDDGVSVILDKILILN